MKIRMPAGARAVISSLQARGYEAYAVGGCVRDSVLSREPDDWDITTSASPSEVKEVFTRTVDTGLQHGTVTVLMGKDQYEVTTYRIDGEYEDGRHPKEVIFTASLKEDLKRRDFTINAMAYNDDEGLVDLFEGMSDLQRKLVRCVGEPTERFSEDALRILRAVRFSAQLGFGIHSDTADAVRKLAPTLSKISAERIAAELTKLLISPRPEYLYRAYELGITRVVLPEFDRMMEQQTGEAALHAAKRVRPVRALRFAAVLYPAGEQAAVSLLRRLKFDNDTIRTAARIIRHMDRQLCEDPAAVRHAVYEVGEDIFPLLLEVRSAYADEKTSQQIQRVQECYETICREGQCVSLKTLAVTGRDLIRLGCRPGPALGELLEAALHEVLDDPKKNTKEYLEAFAKGHLGI